MPRIPLFTTCLVAAAVAGCGSPARLDEWQALRSRHEPVPVDGTAGAPPSLMDVETGERPIRPTGMSAPAKLPKRQEPGSGSPTDLTREALEQMAWENNPTLVQAQAQIQAAAGRAVQAGLYPNPRLGYRGEEMGVEGTAGQQGIFIDQLIVTADKLKLSRAKFSQEATQAQWQAIAQQYRVINGVRMRFYRVLALERALELSGSLLKIAEDAVTTTEELMNVGQANRPDLLAARIEARRARVALLRTDNAYRAAWRELAAQVGNPQVPPTPLQGDLEADVTELAWETTLAHLLEVSPELQIAQARVARNQFALRREQAEPIPNVNLQAGTAYDYDSRDQIASVEVGVRLPIFDRNQGNIHSAEWDLVRSHAERRRVELSLRRRLARVFARYRASRAAVEEYRTIIVPESREAYRLYLESFQKRRAAWPQVLIAQRTFFQSSLEYLETLLELRRAEVAILGLLLVDGLEAPPGPAEAREAETDRIRLEEELDQPNGGRMGRTPNERFGD